MTVLVAAASKHKGTMGIAEAIAAELRMVGYGVDVARIDETLRADRYDVVILGSAVYMGKWLPEALEFVTRNERTLREKPVWLFSSGPLGWEEPMPKDDPACVADLMVRTGARGHAVFIGKLDRRTLGLMERIAARIVNAPEGDFRDWSAIRDWARVIGNGLVPRPVSRTAPATTGEATGGLEMALRLDS